MAFTALPLSGIPRTDASREPGAELWEGDATKQKPKKKILFSMKERKAFNVRGLW